MREPPLQGTFATEMRTIPSRALKKKGPHQAQLLLKL